VRAFPKERQGQDEETRAMTKHKTVTRIDWLVARLELLKAEKELTRCSDELARRRQELRGFGSTRSIDSRLTREAPR
jgi:predicted dithiol-disulfide oxidoreductase (DUF899 family)